MSVGVRVSRHLKELTWATNKQLQVISNMMLFTIVTPLRNQLKVQAK